MRLDRITTRGGDAGVTSLGTGKKVGKASPVVEALGTIDELNCVLGVLEGLLKGRARREVLGIQNDLFDAGADLSVPPRGAARKAFRVSPAHIARLERLLARLNRRQKPLRSFVLPGGTRAAAICHLGRAVCRRAERRVWAVRGKERPRAEIGRYLNRLSDYLFVLARWLNGRKGEGRMWIPGASCARRS